MGLNLGNGKVITRKEISPTADDKLRKYFSKSTNRPQWKYLFSPSVMQAYFATKFSDKTKLYICIKKYRHCLYLTELIIFLAVYTRDSTKGIEEDDGRLLD